MTDYKKRQKELHDRALQFQKELDSGGVGYGAEELIRDLVCFMAEVLDDPPVYEYGIRYKDEAQVDSRIRTTSGEHVNRLREWADPIFDYFRRPKAGDWEKL